MPGENLTRIEAQGPSPLDIAGMAARYGAPCAISGRVTDGAGNGLANAVITCTGKDPNFPYYGPTVQTATDGTYVLPGTSTGSYTVTAALSGRTFSPSSRSVTIGTTSATNIDFTERPTITRSPDTLSFSGWPGATVPEQTFTVTNSGGSSTTLNYNITDDASWLTVTPTNGSLAGGASNTHTVQVVTYGLQQGTNTATITITDPNASNNPQTITVSLFVNLIYTYTGDADKCDIADCTQFVPGDVRDWDDKRNWTPRRVPGANDLVVINGFDVRRTINMSADSKDGLPI